MYLTNKKQSTEVQRSNKALSDLDPMIHSNLQEMSRIQSIKAEIHRQLCSVYDPKVEMDKLISDPAELGRYKNFRGASSSIANYIKSLDKNTRDTFIVDGNKDVKYPMGQVTRGRAQFKIMSQIKYHNNNYTLQLKNREGLAMYDLASKRQTITPRIKITKNNDSSLSFDQDSPDTQRIHSVNRGRLIKPIYQIRQVKKQEVRVTPKTVHLQPITRAQIFDMLNI